MFFSQQMDVTKRMYFFEVFWYCRPSTSRVNRCCSILLPWNTLSWLCLWLVVEIRVNYVAHGRIGVTRDAEFLDCRQCSKIAAKTSGRLNLPRPRLWRVNGETHLGLYVTIRLWRNVFASPFTSASTKHGQSDVRFQWPVLWALAKYT